MRTIGRLGLLLGLGLLGAGRLANATPVLDWSRQLGTESLDTASGVSGDTLGNVFLTGFTQGSLAGPNAGGFDIFLARYNALGTLGWVRQLGSSGNDQPLSVSADGLGNAYISGWTNGSLGGPNAGSNDAFLAKYDAAGSLLWLRQYGTPGEDGSRGVSVDSLGNVYTSGWTYGSIGGPNAGQADCFVSKYDPAGNLQWTRQLGTGSWEASGCSADGLGNVYISGPTQGSLGGPNQGGYDVFAAKYDAGGNLIWTRQLGTPQDDVSYNTLSADALGNVFIGGVTWGSLGGPNAGDLDAFLAKYDAAGNLVWTRQFGTAGEELLQGVSADGFGNAFVSAWTRGSLGGPNAGLTDVYLAMYGSGGDLLWAEQLGTPSYDQPSGVSAIGYGNFYVSGLTDGSLGGPNAGGLDAFVMHYAVPEPATLTLALGGLAVLLARGKARRRG